MTALPNGDFELSKTALAGFAPLKSLALEQLIAGFKKQGVAFLDLRVMPLQPGTQLINLGPAACLAGEISLVAGQMGAPSQVWIRLRVVTEWVHGMLTLVPSENGSADPAEGWGCVQVAFCLKKGMEQQVLHYDVVVGAYLKLDNPQSLDLAALNLLIPGPLAEQVGGSLDGLVTIISEHGDVVQIAVQGHPGQEIGWLPA